MELVLKGKGPPQLVLAALSELTDGAVISPQGIAHRRQAGAVSIAMARKEKVISRSWLGRRVKLSSSWIRTAVEIGCVTECLIDDNLVQHGLKEIELFQGLQFDDGEIWFESVQEHHGVPLFSASLRIAAIEITLRDMYEDS